MPHRLVRLLAALALALSLAACNDTATDTETEPGEGVIEEGSGVDDLSEDS